MDVSKVVKKYNDGYETVREKATAFCRCSLSTNKPYCDGSHKVVQFDK